MKFLTTATLSWFNNGCCDVKYLDEWQNVPVSYHADQVHSAGWHHDHHQQIIATDKSGYLFQQAADLLMRYQFYPSHILSHVSDFSLNDRWVEIGDRIVQRIHIFHLLGRSILDVVSMTEISAVTVEPHRCGFTYVTVATHVEQGEWSIEIAWRSNGDVVLSLDAISRPRLHEPVRNHAFMRAFQKAAHKQGMAYFKQLCQRYGHIPQKETAREITQR